MIRRQNDRRQRDRDGFTLMEMLVVVAIIVVLAGAGALGVLRFLDESKVNTAFTGTKTLETALKACYADPRYGRYPDSLEFLANPGDGARAFVEPGALFDPWHQPFQYNPNEWHPTTGVPKVYSLGPPGKNQPISNW